MADDREIVVGSLITLACSLGVTSLLLKKYIREREQYGECNTLLPELAATEVVKCVHYMRMDHGLCGSNKLLYKRSAKSMGTAEF